MTVDRRRFCTIIAAGCPALGLLGCKRRGALSTPSVAACAVEHRTAATARVLSEPEWSALEAACARIIPTDDDPGATEAHVVNYIDAQLAQAHFASFRRTFSDGLRGLDRLAGGKFAALPTAKQDQILTRMERGVPLSPPPSSARSSRRRRSSRKFFRLLHSFTLEGYLSDPVYGGNKDGVGWRFIGFEIRPPRPRCPYLGWKNSSQTS